MSTILIVASVIVHLIFAAATMYRKEYGWAVWFSGMFLLGLTALIVAAMGCLNATIIQLID